MSELQVGKYFTTISTYVYKRENPYTTGPDSNAEILDAKILLPLPIQLYDRTSSAYSQQNLGVLGDILNESMVSGKVSAEFIESASLRALGTLASIGSRSLPPILSGLIDPAAVTTIAEQSSGLIANPNPVVKFTGPQLRSFNYTWYLAPKSEAESAAVNKIIKTLKAVSLPGKQGFSSTLLTIPKLIQMNFYPWDSEDSKANKWGWGQNSLIKMKRCHITNASVNYNPANVPAFFYDGNPVIIELSIELLEVEYFTEEDWLDLGYDRQLNVNPLLEGVGDLISSGLNTIGTNLLDIITPDFSLFTSEPE
jgi:hypothetical protein